MDKEILFWIQDDTVVKAEVNFETGVAIFYDRFNNILARRTHLEAKQLREIVKQIQKQLTKRKKWDFIMYKKDCSRCGRPLNINEYVQNNRLILVCGAQVVLHFCARCIELVDEGEK